LGARGRGRRGGDQGRSAHWGLGGGRRIEGEIVDFEGVGEVDVEVEGLVDGRDFGVGSWENFSILKNLRKFKKNIENF
jgi:hypothetical protein